jgi:hypothetical protein
MYAEWLCGVAERITLLWAAREAGLELHTNGLVANHVTVQLQRR